MAAETFYLPGLEDGAPGPLPPLPAALGSAEALAAHYDEWVGAFRDHPPDVVRAAARLFPSTGPGTFRRWVEIRSGIAPDAEDEEPLLRPESDRCAMLPLRDEKMWSFRKTIERLHWVAQEVDLSHDRGDWEKVSSGDRELVEHVLAFFSIADELVLEGLDGRISELVLPKEGQFYLRAQSDQECVHSEAYSLQIQEIVPPGRREAVFEAVRTFPTVGRMADWVRWWTRARHPAADVFAAMAFIEGVMFSGFFATLQHYKDKNFFPGVTGLNEFICRDEGIHTLFWCFLLNERVRFRPDAMAVAAIARETVLLCQEFFRRAVPSTVAGLNADLLGQYVRFVADSVAIQLGYEPLFRDSNPFAFMDALALNEVAKTNFFESRVSSYQNPGREGALKFEIDTSEVRL